MYDVYAGCISGSIRFVGGNQPWEGRVEVCKQDTWGTVCDQMWNQEDANVACRQAGYSREGKRDMPRQFKLETKLHCTSGQHKCQPVMFHEMVKRAE